MQATKNMNIAEKPWVVTPLSPPKVDHVSIFPHARSIDGWLTVVVNVSDIDSVEDVFYKLCESLY